MDYSEDKLTEKIIGCFIEVHKVLGPGFLESIYRKALLVELRQGLAARDEVPFDIRYKGELVGQHRVDLIVDDVVITEAKTVHELAPEHYDQLRSYLRATGIRVGLLVNFAKSMAEWRRIEI